MTFVWAYLAGALTLVNPCVLPLLPIVLAAALQASQFGPVALAAGLTVSFTIVGVGVTAFGQAIGIDEQVINRVAAVMIMVFGIVLLVPRAQARLSAITSPLASGANQRLDSAYASGLAGQFTIGMLLGAVWSPCIGPTLGGAIGLAASGEGLIEATLTMFMFGVGISTVLIALAYGSREALSARKNRLAALMPWAKPIMGVTLLLVGLGIFLHWERAIESWLLDIMPIWLQDLSVRV